MKIAKLKCGVYLAALGVVLPSVIGLTSGFVAAAPCDLDELRERMVASPSATWASANSDCRAGIPIPRIGESAAQYADRSAACDKEVSANYKSAADPAPFHKACMDRTEPPEAAAERKARESREVDEEYRRTMAEHERLVVAEKKAAAAKAAWAKRPSGVRIGMTKAEVLATKWGKPESINSTVSRYGEREQWVYGGRQYLYFENGILTSIQQSR